MSCTLGSVGDVSFEAVTAAVAAEGPARRGCCRTSSAAAVTARSAPPPPVTAAFLPLADGAAAFLPLHGALRRHCCAPKSVLVKLGKEFSTKKKKVIYCQSVNTQIRVSVGSVILYTI